ncbi:MAG: protein-disulfide reductase DsbD family protein [Fimbriimonadales bacterium]|nr:protein-disulfide reductase DsbD family protein [Fimbriimonadales bacterium]
MLALLAATLPIASGTIVQLRLVAESRTFVPGRPVRAAVVLDVPEGWHVYWENPGDSGQPPSVRWKLPPGWRASDPTHPAPKSHADSDFASFVHEGKLLLPVAIEVPRSARGRARLTAEAEWLVCKEGCIPERASASLELAEGRSPEPSGASAAIAAAFAALPERGGTGWLRWEGDQPVVGFQGSADATAWEVFPAEGGVLRHRQPLASAQRDGGGWILRLNRSEFLAGRPESLRLLLVPTDAQGRRLGPGRYHVFRSAGDAPAGSASEKATRKQP